jgi:hypothetical protein
MESPARPSCALITPRRHFLRAFGLTAAGATLPIPILLADTPAQRIELQLTALARSLNEIYPETELTTAFRQPDPTWEVGFSPLVDGDIVAVVRASGVRTTAAQRA